MQEVFKFLRLGHYLIGVCLFTQMAVLSPLLGESHSFERGLKLEAIQSICYPSEGYTEALNKAVADFTVQWYYRVGNLLEIAHDLKVTEYALVLKKSRIFKSKKRGAFSIKRKGSSVYIHSWDSEGWTNALYTLAQDVLGVRWYWPNSLGLEWIGSVPEYFPNKSWAEAPSFEVRNLYGLDREYAQRNRLNKAYAFNHNLAKVFKPEYQDYFPEAYAQLGNRVSIPKGSLKYDPQPNLSHSSAVTIAALAAIKHFEENPNALSFSLSPNDNVLFDTSKNTQSIIEPIEYFRGRPNYSDLTFSFANQVAEIVFEKEGFWKTDEGLPRYLCMLAYYWTEQVPELTLHPRIIPILTSDRSQWHDRTYAQEDKDLIKRWAQLGTDKLGAWDYYFGAPFPYPRQFNTYIAESLNYLKEQGVEIFFSQAASLWGLDGPKSWISAQLLWDSDRALEDLLEEFYCEFFGAAEKPMRAFYELAEKNRNMHAGKAEWIKYYYDEAGIEVFSVTVLNEMRSYLDEAQSLVPVDSRFGKRIKIVSEAFEITEAYANYHQFRKKLLAHIFGLTMTTEGSLESLIKAFETSNRRYEDAVNGIAKKDYHKQWKAFARLQQSNPVPASLLEIVAGTDRDRSDPLSFDGYRSELSLLRDWQMHRTKYKGLIQDPFLGFDPEASEPRDFLGPCLPKLNDWRIDFRASEKFSLSPLKSDGKKASGLEITGSDSFALYTHCELGSTRNYLLDLAIKFRVSPDSRIQFRVDWLDSMGETIAKELTLQLPNGANSEFKNILIPMIAPKKAEHAKIYCLVSRQAEGDHLSIQTFNWISK